ncbi:MAG: hypothetical protein NVS4B5_11050 [Vulcanimicrobiaceae bacterium]
MGMISKLGYVRWASLGLAFVLLASCAPSKTQATAPAGTGTARPRILVSISTFVSFARAVAGDRADVSTLVPVGASPEDYQPTPADIEKIHTADILVENGLGLETWLARRNNVRAVFAEPEYNPKLVRTLAQSAGIATVENLYDDSIGSDHRVTDYESMLRYDTATIVAALGGRTR